MLSAPGRSSVLCEDMQESDNGTVTYMHLKMPVHSTLVTAICIAAMQSSECTRVPVMAALAHSCLACIVSRQDMAGYIHTCTLGV